jgi:hypothetical protein
LILLYGYLWIARAYQNQRSHLLVGKVCLGSMTCFYLQKWERASYEALCLLDRSLIKLDEFRDTSFQ